MGVTKVLRSGYIKLYAIWASHGLLSDGSISILLYLYEESRHIKNEGNTIIVANIMDINPTDKSNPMLAVPWCDENARFPILNIVVSLIIITPFIELVI